tara:strand:+ start:698 stop:1630 length:933 start_codon:yes stop_codon:yes gene_type:complete
MFFKKILIFLTFVVLINNNFSYGFEIKIKAEIDNIIITNIDIENEKKYLIFLNSKLRELNQIDLDKVAKESLIREVIKEKELKKFFDTNIKYKLVDKIEQNLLLKKNLKKNELIDLLEINNMDYEQIRKKLRIEALWNQLIYKKYIKNIKIDEVLLKKRILDQFSKTEKKYEYNLSEIVFEQKLDESYETTIKIIDESIKNVGFENTANILSISNSSKNGGLIGWVNELQISKEINNKLKELNINEVTKPIKIPNGYLLIKVNDKKELTQELDIEKELKNLIDYETNNQLNNFSIIFYKRLKQNTEINEY